MRSSITLMTVLATCAMLLACEHPTEKPTLSPEAAAQARRTMVEWLECEECEEGQLEAVTKLGPVIIPSLAAALREGPAPASRELIRGQLEARYDRLKAYEKTHPYAKVASGRAEFVEYYLGNYEALYKVRAATALGEFDDWSARQALQDALDVAKREDVRRAIKVSLKKTP